MLRVYSFRRGASTRRVRRPIGRGGSAIGSGSDVADRDEALAALRAMALATAIASLQRAARASLLSVWIATSTYSSTAPLHAVLLN